MKIYQNIWCCDFIMLQLEYETETSRNENLMFRATFWYADHICSTNVKASKTDDKMLQFVIEIGEDKRLESLKLQIIFCQKCFREFVGANKIFNSDL